MFSARHMTLARLCRSVTHRKLAGRLLHRTRLSFFGIVARSKTMLGIAVLKLLAEIGMKFAHKHLSV